MYNCDFSIYKSASLLVDDFNMAYTDDKGTLNDAKNKNGLHIVDAFRYMIDCVLQFDKWQDYVRYYAKGFNLLLYFSLTLICLGGGG